MKIAFGMIVFNSDFVLREVLESIYPYAEQVLIAEGPVKYWSDKGYTTSTDRTNEILESFPDPDNKIKIVRGPYPEKDDMCNKYIEHMNNDIDYIWHVDADEVYKSEDIEKIIELLEKDKYTSVGFKCYSFYGGMDRYITGYEESYEFMRLFKVYPGTNWLTHRPPTVKHLDGVQKLPENHLSFNKLDEEHGVRVYHYSYVFPRQVYEKISYYKAAVSKENCRDNYFEEIYMPWVLGDEEAKNIIEKNNNGVHEFISRSSTFTKKLERNHPEVITNNLEQLESIYHSQLKHYFYKIGDIKTAWYDEDILPSDMAIKSVEWELDKSDHFVYLKEAFDMCREYKSIADLGCGAGNVGKVFSDMDYVGYDLDHIIEKVSKKVNPELSYISFDAYDTDFEFCKNYDVVLSNSFITELKYCGNILYDILDRCNKYVILHRQGFSEL